MRDAHAADENRIDPGKLSVPRTLSPTKADFPGLWKHRRDNKQTLRQDELVNPIGRRTCVLDGAERKHAYGTTQMQATER